MSHKLAVFLSIEESQGLNALQLIQAKYTKLKVANAKQALQLLCQSERVHSDLNAYMAMRGKFDGMSIILREWMEQIPFDMYNNHLSCSSYREFRCFVHKKQLTAISQYQCYHIFESLQNEQLCETIQAAILHFHEQTKGTNYHMIIDKL